MSQFPALTIQSGVTTQIKSTKELIVGAGIDTDTLGTQILTIGSTNATSIVLAKATSIDSGKTFTFNGNLAGAGGSTFDYSGSSGTFKTSTGLVTIGPGNTTMSGVTTFTAADSGSYPSITTAVTVNHSLLVSGLLISAGTHYATGGISTNSIISPSATTLDIGTSGANSVVLGSGSAPVTVQGSLTVQAGFSSGHYPIVSGTSGTKINSETSSTTSDGTGVALANKGNIGLEVVYGGSSGTVTVFVPSGSVLEASGSGQIIATSVSGGSSQAFTLPAIDTSGVLAVGDAVYMSADSVVLSCDCSVLAKSYCVGFSVDGYSTGNIYTDGTVVPNFSTPGGSPLSPLPTFGQVMYLDSGTFGVGKVNYNPPTTSGYVVAPVGVMIDGTPGSVRMLIRVMTPVVL